MYLPLNRFASTTGGLSGFLLKVYTGPIEYDTEQGQLIRMLQNNILTITVLLVAVIFLGGIVSALSLLNIRLF